MFSAILFLCITACLSATSTLDADDSPTYVLGCRIYESSRKRDEVLIAGPRIAFHEGHPAMYEQGRQIATLRRRDGEPLMVDYGVKLEAEVYRDRRDRAMLGLDVSLVEVDDESDRVEFPRYGRRVIRRVMQGEKEVVQFGGEARKYRLKYSIALAHRRGKSCRRKHSIPSSGPCERNRNPKRTDRPSKGP